VVELATIKRVSSHLLRRYPARPNYDLNPVFMAALGMPLSRAGTRRPSTVVCIIICTLTNSAGASIQRDSLLDFVRAFGYLALEFLMSSGRATRRSALFSTSFELSLTDGRHLLIN
jgi:hypothetical protein